MNIIAGSRSVGVESEFLHVGYCSAHPHGLEMVNWSWQDLGDEAIPVAAALELVDGQAVDTTALVEVHSGRWKPAWRATLEGHHPDGWTLVGLAVALLAVAALLLPRRRGRWLWRRRALAACLVVAVWFPLRAFVADTAYCSMPELPVLSYKDPEAATHVIVKAIAWSALIGHSADEADLSAAQPAAGLPVRPEEMTPGIAYAIATYSRDGWGRPLRAGGKGRRRVLASAGQDGEFDTADDIVQTSAVGTSTWEHMVSGVFVQCDDEGMFVFAPRVEDHTFKQTDAERAQEITGTPLYGLAHVPGPAADWDGDEWPYGRLAGYVRKRLDKGVLRRDALYFVSNPAPVDMDLLPEAVRDAVEAAKAETGVSSMVTADSGASEEAR